jgi:hypothetical protein
MYHDMSAEQAAEFSEDLRDAADRLERAHARKPNRPHGAGWNGVWDASRQTIKYETASTFEGALATIRRGARWYGKVASLGYGVHAWY